tara:strand:- start:264 stop:773 length:510 start_codon:yes stop_codon:yes gene_type:complete
MIDSIKFHTHHNIAMWQSLSKDQIKKTIKLIKKFKGKKHENISNTDWNVDSEDKREYMEYLWQDCLVPFRKAFMEVTKANEIILHNYWYQRYFKNDHHKWHTHPGAHFTCVLYLQNTLDNPTQIQGMTLDRDAFTEGNILCFPAHIFHSSAKNKNVKEKIIVSFNISIR